MLSTVELGTAFTAGSDGAAERDGPRPGLSGRVFLPHPLALRRQLNVVVAGGAIAVLSPVLLLTAAALKLVGRGPVLDREIVVGVDRRSPLAEPLRWRRVTDHGGRLFAKYTFRDPSRRASGETPPRSRVKQALAGLLTRLFRAYGIDQLPLLFNVVRGDMNVVGPRPRSPDVLARLRRQDPGWLRLQRVLPGIIGAAGVAGPGAGSHPRHDRQLIIELGYIDRQSVREDLRIMVRALRTVLTRATAEPTAR